MTKNVIVLPIMDIKVGKSDVNGWKEFFFILCFRKCQKPQKKSFMNLYTVFTCVASAVWGV